MRHISFHTNSIFTLLLAGNCWVWKHAQFELFITLVFACFIVEFRSFGKVHTCKVNARTSVSIFPFWPCSPMPFSCILSLLIAGCSPPFSFGRERCTFGFIRRLAVVYCAPSANVPSISAKSNPVSCHVQNLVCMWTGFMFALNRLFADFIVLAILSPTVWLCPLPNLPLPSHGRRLRTAKNSFAPRQHQISQLAHGWRIALLWLVSFFSFAFVSFSQFFSARSLCLTSFVFAATRSCFFSVHHEEQHEEIHAASGSHPDSWTTCCSRGY